MFRSGQLKALFENRHILIAGYGREGRSSEQLIRQLCPQVQMDIADGNEAIANAIRRGGYDMIIKSPGIPMSALRGLPIAPSVLTSQTDLFLRVYHDRTIGVSGTKGKSTTTSLIHHLLSHGGQHSVLAGNIGIPLFDIVPQLTPTTWVTAELSCHQLEGISQAPHVAVLLNLYQEHLDHYDNYLGYQMAKMQIALRQQPSDHYFYCEDNADLDTLTGQQPLCSHLHPFGENRPTPFDDQIRSHLQLLGQHNFSNAQVACQVAALAEADIATFGASLQSFVGLPHRLQYVGYHGGIHWYNDSISTIPEATIAALQALGVDRVSTLILGGLDRGIDYSSLGNFLSEHPVQHIAFTGDAGRRMCNEWKMNLSITERYFFCNDYVSLIHWCKAHTTLGKVCLLSPAAASYDKFRNFEHRGDVFAQLAMF